MLTQIDFLHIDTNQYMRDGFAQAQENLCKVELANYHTRLQTLAGTNNLYALINEFGRGYIIKVSGAASYIIK